MAAAAAAHPSVVVVTTASSSAAAASGGAGASAGAGYDSGSDTPASGSGAAQHKHSTAAASALPGDYDASSSDAVSSPRRWRHDIDGDDNGDDGGVALRWKAALVAHPPPPIAAATTTGTGVGCARSVASNCGGGDAALSADGGGGGGADDDGGTGATTGLGALSPRSPPVALPKPIPAAVPPRLPPMPRPDAALPATPTLLAQAPAAFLATAEASACRECRDRWAAESAAAAAATPTHDIKRSGRPTYTVCDVARHNRPDDCWLAAHGQVYDVTAFIRRHPGGVGSILRHAGQESGRDFDFHSSAAQRLWAKYAVGSLRPCLAAPDAGRGGLCVVQ